MKQRFLTWMVAVLSLLSVPQGVFAADGDDIGTIGSTAFAGLGLKYPGTGNYYRATGTGTSGIQWWTYRYGANSDKWNTKWDGFNVIRDCITDSKPYLEIEYADWVDTSTDDWFEGINIYFDDSYRTETHRIYPLAYMSKNHDKMVTENKWGAVQILTTRKEGNKRWVLVRVYPSDAFIKEYFNASTLNKKACLCVEGGWDYSHDGGSYVMNPYKTTGISTTDNNKVDNLRLYRFDIRISSEAAMPSYVYYLPGQIKLTTPSTTYSSPNGSIASDGSASTTTKTRSYGITLSRSDGKDGFSINGSNTSTTISDVNHSSTLTLTGYPITLLGMPVVNGSYQSSSNQHSSETTSIASYVRGENQEIKVNALPIPTKVSLTFDQWNKKVKVSWTKNASESVTSGKWYVYRKVTGTTGDPTLLTAEGVTYATSSYEDAGFDYDKNYTYYVVFGHSNWVTNGWTPASEFQSSIAKSATVKTTRTLGTTTISQDKTFTTGIKIDWTYGSIKTTGVQFKVYRKLSSSTIWGDPIATVNNSSTTATKASYTDTSISNPALTYNYKVEAEVLGKTFTFPSSGDFSASLDSNTRSKVVSVKASKGTYQGVVKLNWEASQYGTDATTYQVLRTVLSRDSQDEELALIHTVQGTATSYTYEDITALPGQYYRYYVRSIKPKAATTDPDQYDVVEDEGFCLSTGTVSGRLTYGTGVAVPDAKIVLVKSDNNSVTDQYYSLKVTDRDGGVQWENLDKIREICKPGKAFSVSLYVRPDNGITDASSFFNLGTVMGVGFNVIEKDPAHYKLRVQMTSGEPSDYSRLLLDKDKFNFVNISTEGDGKWTFTVIRHIVTADGGTDIDIQSYTKSHDVNALNLEPVLCFGSTSVQKYLTYFPSSFHGYIDDVRVWNKALSAEELSKNFDRILSGSEPGLKLYWTFDEGLPVVYDLSRTSGAPNENHGKLLPNTEAGQTIIPLDEQLSLYGRTDTEGNYVVRGIPFNGEGTNYSIQPVLGVHEFSPSHLTRYISGQSLNHSAVDFTDVSSFKVTGQAYYANSTYPVEGATLYVDGVICSREGVPVKTNENGQFEISVPIGDHYITVKKDGHVFQSNGRYPADDEGTGTTYTFEKDESNLTFWDETLVPFIGRVVGGTVERDKPVGFGESVGNIGRAQIVLEASKSLNASRVINGTVATWTYGSTALAVPTTGDGFKSPNLVNSTTVRNAGDINGSKQVTITTDGNTGEFCAMLPPVPYTVKSVTLLDATAEDLTTFTTKNWASTIDLSNAHVIYSEELEKQTTDEKNKVTKETIKMDYVDKFVPTFLAKSVLEVTQKDMTDNSFGISEYEVSDNYSDLAPYTVNDFYDATTGVYKYGAPVFLQQEEYTFLLKGYEKYVNRYVEQGEEPVVYQQPLIGTTVKIQNQLGADVPVYLDTADGKNAGEAAITGNEGKKTLTLDSLGCATYKWRAGLPNITSPYTRTISIAYEVNGGDINWTGSPLNGIILGNLATGNNFVTSGPDLVEMVLRDPPGSNSYSTWEKGTSVTTSFTANKGIVNDIAINTVSKFGANTWIIAGTPGTGTITEGKATSDLTVGMTSNVSYEDTNTFSVTNTLTESVSTSSEDFVGADGDVFIGHGTNITFGDSHCLSFSRTSSTATPTLGVFDQLTSGLEFGTAFRYTQHDIETRTLPNLLKLRNETLKTMTQAEINSYVNNTDKPVYLTTLSSDDPKFGSNNGDQDVWGNDKRTDGKGPSYWMILPESSNVASDAKIRNNKPVYQDDILWYNTQIDIWKQTLANNEKAKVDAINKRDTYLKNNYSFDAGTTVSVSETVTKDTVYTNTYHIDAALVAGFKSDVEINGTGVDFSVDNTTTVVADTIHESTTSREFTVSYELAESGVNDALTVDVYTAPDGYGPIFVTRAGQTSAPYEGKVETKYYQPGTEISAATMQIEVPQIAVENPLASDVPSGKAAIYTLKLSNASATKTDGVYILKMDDNTNANGAQLYIDGEALTSGRPIKVPYGEIVTKTLQLKQSDRSKLTYDNIRIWLMPSDEDEDLSSSCMISASFVPASTDVNIDIATRTLNTSTGQVLSAVIKDFDRSFTNFKSIRFEYKYANDPDWTVYREYVLNAANVSGTSVLMPATGNISVDLDMNPNLFKDGNYQFRAVSVTTYGNQEITATSEVIDVVKDMARPQILGSANPSDGILSAGDDISVKFNEAIRNGALSSENFLIIGKLNDAQVAHDVALQLNGAANPAATEAAINLSGSNFSADMWLKRSSAGTIFSHGTKENSMKLSVNAEGNAVLKVGDNTYTSTTAIPADKWVFLTFSYDQDNNKFSANYAQDASEINLFSSIDVPRYTGNGRVILGDGLTGAIHEVTLWNTARTALQAISEKSEQKAGQTPGLIGYWKFDEGHGINGADAARSRNMVLANESWYMQNTNYAAKLSGDNYIGLDMTKVSPRAKDSYAVELWFQGDAQNNATLWSVGENKIALGFNAAGKLALTLNGAENKLSDKNFLDNQWHHVALNVLRGGSAIVYVDGSNVKTMNESNVPSIETNKMIVGAQRHMDANVETFNKYFTGAVDEIRIWNANLSGNYLNENRFTRLDVDKVSGLVAYYPMEKSALDANEQVQTTFSLEDASADKVETTYGSATQAANAPSLKSAPNMTNLQFNFTASSEEIYVTLLDDANRLEGTTVNITVKNVLDQNNNVSLPVTWTAYVSQNGLKWTDDKLTLSKPAVEEMTFEATITNKSGVAENWTITGIPAYITASETEGVLSPEKSQTITFTIEASAAVGTHNETFYLSGNNIIAEPLTIDLLVKANEPNWTVDGSAYEGNVTVAAQTFVGDRLLQNTNSLIAAFIDDKCVGVTSPAYVPTRDTYYTMLTVYGETAGKAVSFKVWDAETGVVYSSVNSSVAIEYTDGNVYGSMSQPVILKTNNEVEQTVNLNKGWNWASFYVAPTNTAIASVFASAGENVASVKDKQNYANYTPEMNGLFGGLTNVSGGAMYKVKAAADIEMLVHGASLDPTQTTMTVNNGWSWLGVPVDGLLSLDDAFAGLNPAVDDLVKSQNAFAFYNGYTWEGTLTVIEPGKGYLYNTGAAGSKTFTFPKAGSSALRAPRRASSAEETHFEAINDSKYPSNMTITAVVVDGEEIVTDAEVAVFVDGECRYTTTQVLAERYFLSVPGNGSEGLLEFRIYRDGKETSFVSDIHYTDDAIVGTYSAPYMLQVNGTTGINSLNVEGANTGIYLLDGRKISNGDDSQRLKRGLYIQNNKKVKK